MEIQLRPPHHRVERRAVGLWTARALALVLPVVLVLGTAATIWPGSRTWTLPLLVAAAVLGALYAAVMPSWRYAVHRWEVTDEAVYAAAGWFVREWRIAPLSRIQTVDTVRGPMDQLLNLSTLVVTTASSSGAVTIRGLAPGVAREAADRLNTSTQLTPGDAT
ncbi:PH domain-containing protein [Streptomyces sp. P38-E01]|uniref:PH domain-containing protein n=1 Tax=Streptomyces tardus TaxID=2780544 RepID=A0A949N1W2_9ACTN|nr:PH domain-containing protein [Streptomyces tardus]MBU7598295.1 PH domain-containing protein [Streptomyces tardus]